MPRGPAPVLPIRAVFCDMDGTLLSPQHRVSPYTIDVLQRLRAAGVKFVIATGRPYADVRATLRETGLRPDYVITSNGARVHDGGDGGGADRKLLISHDMDPQAVWEAVQIRQQPKEDGMVDESCGPKAFSVHVYQHEEWLADEDDPVLRACFHPSFPFRLLSSDSLRGRRPDDWRGCHQVFYSGAAEDMPAAAAFARRHFGSRLDVASSGTTNVEFAPIGVSKGTAVAEVAERLGVPLAQAAFFGDARNDLPGMALVGHAFVMPNAAEDVRRLATAEYGAQLVSHSNAEDGVAKKIEELFFSPNQK